MRIRTYSELRLIDSFEDRYEYLRLKGVVGEPTFGYERYHNQRFYTSRQWKQVRDYVITRDLGNDLGADGYGIHQSERIIIHHMNPMTPDNIIHGDADILNPEFLITTTHNTHNAVHYGDISLLTQVLVERRPGDTKLW
ncbi:HNH endonuclease [Arthrobacter phage Qui]|uniref:HNH endonuclease n=1 Tax=Arthrobacter phage Qui TaxID=2603260 RepID=A0A5B8WPB0_9CAUD|nr:HNH endonuclease [Arthrobacter phage Qui]QED11498.1 HNH endonuclease [Arthrobacter phage Qui]QOC56329.1 HNH endonuclease [Arthrobacter phage Paella]